ncbi:aldehyde dehydrogenase family protein [Allokutzneria sp. A3M-2-11 16]|uniref:aldehyde dehydrogenase family protein n=1 Tax=Allokutzneria sp. A3M-2-11 16 TaxID=2962043 RepID=UPI0020B6B6A9|nr:aldehyde dehydrogenase family protein [Allokutzneria sp. A3M-2-11 16]MCP3804908.1 aldehyde dehydrogenase family protein [Allokutzneria sp. A3M-2-11 16]
MTDVVHARVIEIRSPEDGSPVWELPMASEKDVSDACAAARSAFPGWARTSAAERGAALHAAAAHLRDRADDLARLNHEETGRDTAEAREGVLAGASTLVQYAELGPLHRGRSLLGAHQAVDMMVPEPRGVVIALTPWNDPVAVSCGLIGAALVTGNVVIHKPSERCPRTGLVLGEVLGAHVPDGVMRTLMGDGDVGARLVLNSDADVIAHVGSTATGHAIAEAAARTGSKTLLENGGNDPLLIDSDVDPEWAAEQAALGAFANCGQICTSVERIYVHQDIARPFITALTRLAVDTKLPPLVDRRHRDHVHGHVMEALARGAERVAGGEIPSGAGAQYPATVLTGCEPGMAVLAEETFGPVAPVRVVRDFEQGLAEAASGPYGLAATVLTDSAEHAQRAWRELPVGTVKVNAVFGGAPGGAAQPRGASGTGYGYGPELLDEMTTTKVLHMAIAGGRR